MKIATDHAVSIHYTLTDDHGNTIDTSCDRDEPLAYLHGYGNIIPGLEKELTGRSVGDNLKVTIEPADGYGEHNTALIQQVPREAFGEGAELEVGMQFQAEMDEDVRLFTITAINGDTVTVDGNHPLAGHRLHFAVEVTGVRPATEEELAHGHIHGAGGHHHH